jgi:hypothetical protein
MRIHFQGNYTKVRIYLIDGEKRVKRLDVVRLSDILEELGFPGAVLSEPELAYMDISQPSHLGRLHMSVQTNSNTLVDLLLTFEELGDQECEERLKVERAIRQLVRAQDVRADLLTAQGFPTSDLRRIETATGVLVV